MAAGDVRVKWYGDRVFQTALRNMGNNLDAAAVFVQGKVKASFGSSPAGKGVKAGRKPHSRPGHPPNIQTGNLKRNIGWDRGGRGGMTRRIGTGIGGVSSVGYAMYLEMGTGKMAARPYLKPGVRNNENQIKRILATKVL